MSPTVDPGHLLSNSRHQGESFENYRARRVLTQAAVDKHLKGQMAYVSSPPVTLPPAGQDPDIDEAVRRGQYRDLVPAFVPVSFLRLDLPGVPERMELMLMRVGRVKGTTYHRPEDAVSSKGRGKRRRQAFKPLPLEERIVKEGV